MGEGRVEGEDSMANKGVTALCLLVRYPREIPGQINSLRNFLPVGVGGQQGTFELGLWGSPGQASPHLVLCAGVVIPPAVIFLPVWG